MRARSILGFVVVAAIALGAGAVALRDERPMLRFLTPEPPRVEYPTHPYDGGFTFARIKFRPTMWAPGDYFWGLDLKWNHDYPAAEINFSKILDELTMASAKIEGGNIIGLDDPRLFEYPWVYFCEAGFWNPTEEEAENLRQYMLRGGFVVLDDMFDELGTSRAWDNLSYQIQRVLPGVVLYPLDVSHPIFRVFFELDDIDFYDEQLRYQPQIYGIFEDNDPARRMMAVVNYNMDIGDYWEWSDQDIYPANLTEKGFKAGINYLMYGFLH